MNKDELLDALEDEREKFLEAIEGLDDQAFSEHGLPNGWSINDVLFHLSTTEAELVKFLWQLSQNQKPVSIKVIDHNVHAPNPASQDQEQLRSSDQLFDDFASVRKQTSRRVAAIPEKDLLEPNQFPWLNDHPLWEWIANDSFKHEAWHTQEIKAWRDSLEI